MRWWGMSYEVMAYEKARLDYAEAETELAALTATVKAAATAPSTWGGAWRRGSGRVGGRHGTHQVTLRRRPLSRRGHQPRRVAVLPLSPEPAHGRRNAGRPRHRREPRDRAPVGAQVRPGV